jgi:hypothetical protein
MRIDADLQAEIDARQPSAGWDAFDTVINLVAGCASFLLACVAAYGLFIMIVGEEFK